jgi:RNA polymerase sigma factor (TIGR02999 family)
MNITALLNRAREGDEDAGARAFAALSDEMRRVAASLMRGRTGHTLQPTAVVNEAYLRLAGVDCAWQNRGHFLAFAAKTMRSVLVDHARRGRAQKRGAGWQREPLTPAVAWYEDQHIDLVALDVAMERLGRDSARELQIVELRFFAGLTVAEVAEVLDLSVATVNRDWTTARAWLYRYMKA